MLVLGLSYLILYLNLSNPLLLSWGQDWALEWRCCWTKSHWCPPVMYTTWGAQGSWGPALAHGLRKVWQELMYLPFRNIRGGHSFIEVISNSRGRFSEVEVGHREWKGTHSEIVSCLCSPWKRHASAQKSGRCLEMTGKINCQTFNCQRRNTMQTSLDEGRVWELPKDTSKPIKCLKWRYFACALIFISTNLMLNSINLKSEYTQMHVWKVSTNSMRKRAARLSETYCLLVCLIPKPCLHPLSRSDLSHLQIAT